MVQCTCVVSILSPLTVWVAQEMSYRETLSSLGVCVTFELSYMYVFLSMFTVYHFFWPFAVCMYCPCLVYVGRQLYCVCVWFLLLGFLEREVCLV